VINCAKQGTQCFPNLDTVFDLEGDKITSDPISDLIVYQCYEVQCYVKRYYTAGKGIRAFRLKPRVQAEWENTQRFAQWGIRSEKIIAFGMERKLGAFKRGALITQGIPNCKDLKSLAAAKSPLLKDRQWIATVSQQVAEFTRIMHQHKFAHNDLKWRNILVDHQQKVYFIDCPTGRFWFGPFLQYRIIKDLACLDKVAKHELSNTQRLRFYLHYAQKKRLDKQDKRKIRKILRFFSK
jgi:tRNA A-37 threonylcarbamoyl transferase component Bud32